MGRVTIAVKLKPEPNRANEHVVRIRITKDRQAVPWALSIAVPEKHFNPNGTKQLQNWVRKANHDYQIYNARILDHYKRVESAVAYFEGRGQPYTAEQVRTYLEGGGLADYLLPFMTAHIAQRRAEAGSDLGKIGTADAYEKSLKVFRRYLRATHNLPDAVGLPDSELNTRYWLLSRFQKKDVLDLRAWMEQHFAHNTVIAHLRTLRHILFVAADAGLVSYERFPMRGVPTVARRKNVERLQEDEVEKLNATQFTKRPSGARPVTDPIHAPVLALAMYYVHGARISDAIMWRAGNYVVEGTQHRLRYITGKNDRDMSVLLGEEVINLLAPYRLRPDGSPKAAEEFLFPYLPENFDTLPPLEQYNTLKRCKNRAGQQITIYGTRIGLSKHLTPHIMRHSFADLMRRNGVPLETRQEVLAHADIATTRNYELQFDQPAVDKVSELYARRQITEFNNSSTNLPVDDNESLPGRER